MADIKPAYKILMQREFSNNPDNFVHKNKGEDFLTVAGLYRKWHQKAIDWDFVDRVIRMTGGNLTIASNLLIKDKELQSEIFKAFNQKFWIANKLDKVDSQKIANEIFISATNIGSKNTIKMVQRLIGAKQDGIIGKNTLGALNRFDEDFFDSEFDKAEIENYENIARHNPNISHNLKGWIKRSLSV